MDLIILKLENEQPHQRFVHVIRPPFIDRCHRSFFLRSFSFRISCPLFAYLTPGLSKRNPTPATSALQSGGFTHGFFFAVKTFPPSGILCPLEHLQGVPGVRNQIQSIPQFCSFKDRKSNFKISTCGHSATVCGM